MASSYSAALLLELMATGDQSGTWGTTTNTNLGTLLEQAITGVLSVAQGDVANLTLTSINGTSDQARNAVIILTGAMTAGRNVVVPTSNKLYLVKNSTTGGFAVTVKTVAGTGVAIAAATSQWVYCDGVNVVAGLNAALALDANSNLTVNNLLEGYATTATAAGTTTLTVASTYQQFFTGSTTQTLVMPVTSTLVLGQAFWVQNLSTGAVTVNSSGSNAILVLAGGTSALFTCILTSGTSAASWSATYFGDAVASGKKLTVSNSLTLAGTDATTMTFPSTSATIARTDAANTFTGVQTMTSPVLTTPDLGTPSALVATNATGTAASLTAGITRALKSATTTVDVSAATAPSATQVLTATDSTHATWQAALGRTLIATLTTTSGSTQTTGTLATTYSSWELELDGVSWAGSNVLTTNLSSDGGSTFDTALNATLNIAGPVYGKISIGRVALTGNKVMSAVVGQSGNGSSAAVGHFAIKTSPTNCLQLGLGTSFTAGAAYLYGVP
jgi:hypothetical protein